MTKVNLSGGVARAAIAVAILAGALPACGGGVSDQEGDPVGGGVTGTDVGGKGGGDKAGDRTNGSGGDPGNMAGSRAGNTAGSMAGAGARAGAGMGGMAGGGTGGMAGGGAGGVANGVAGAGMAGRGPGHASICIDMPDKCDYMVYVGGSEPSIEGFAFNVTTGVLGNSIGKAPAGSGILQPTYLSFHPTGNAIYASNETDMGALGALAVEPRTGKLTALNQKPSGGSAGVHTTVHPGGKWVLVSNYGGGNVSVFPIRDDGSLGDATDTEQTGKSSHQIKLTPDGRYAYAPCRGPNHVVQMSFNDGTLTKLDPPTIASDDPRHIAFSSDGKFGYLLNEEPANVVVYSVSDGRLKEIQKVNLAGGESWGAHIEVTPDDRFVYASGRHTHRIYVYERNMADGKITARGSYDSDGKVNMPRDFTLDPAGNHLIVAGQARGRVHVLRINRQTGALTDVGTPRDTVGGARAVIVVPIPRP